MATNFTYNKIWVVGALNVLFYKLSFSSLKPFEVTVYLLHFRDKIQLVLSLLHPKPKIQKSTAERNTGPTGDIYYIGECLHLWGPWKMLIKYTDLENQ